MKVLILSETNVKERLLLMCVLKWLKIIMCIEMTDDY